MKTTGVSSSARLAYQRYAAGVVTVAMACGVLAANDQVLVDPPASVIPPSKSIQVPIPQSDQWDQKCASNKMLANTTKTTDSYRQDFKGVGTFHWNEPSRVFLSIESVQHVGGKLRIRFLSKAKLHEHTGPLVDTIRWTKYGASPVAAAVGHTITLGLGILFSPVKSAQHAFGCTDYFREQREVDWTRRTPTGNHIWVDVSSTANLVISALGEELLIESPVGRGEKPLGEVVVDLDPLVKKLLNAELQGPTALHIACRSCVELDAAERSAFDIVGSQGSLDVDLRPFQSAERERVRQVQVREEEIRREAQLREQEEIAKKRRQAQEEAARRKKAEDDEKQRQLQRQKKEQIFSM